MGLAESKGSIRAQELWPLPWPAIIGATGVWRSIQGLSFVFPAGKFQGKCFSRILGLVEGSLPRAGVGDEL